MLTAGGPAGRLLSAVFRWSYRRASYVVSLGPTMTRRLLKKGVAETRIREISNWATGDTGVVRGESNRLRSDWGLTGKFVLLYSGNLGVAHEIQTLIRAVALALPRVPHLSLVFIGKGGRLEEARQLARELSLERSVSFEKFVPFNLLPHSLGLADLAVVTLRPGFEGLVVPSKLFGHMARGVPTLYVGPHESDVALLIERSGGGVSVANGDIESLAESIAALAVDPDRLRRMGEAAQAYYRQKFRQEIGIGSYLNLVRSVIG
jgi:glycosyltransferase involved in cell wall biosynthesis